MKLQKFKIYDKEGNLIMDGENPVEVERDYVLVIDTKKLRIKEMIMMDELGTMERGQPRIILELFSKFVVDNGPNGKTYPVTISEAKEWVGNWTIDDMNEAVAGVQNSLIEEQKLDPKKG